MATNVFLHSAGHRPEDNKMQEVGQTGRPKWLGRGRKPSKEPVTPKRSQKRTQPKPHRLQSCGEGWWGQCHDKSISTRDSREAANGGSRSPTPAGGSAAEVPCAYLLEAGGVQLSLVDDLHSYLNTR